MANDGYSARHPHEPDVPPTLDTEGRCLVCVALTATARLVEADLWERRAYELEAQARGWIDEAMSSRQRASNRRAEVGHCHHCGQPDEADGDHSCLCPNRDEECGLHPLPEVVDAT